jgi:hypothetical protein
MEESPENGKESSHSAHANGMNETFYCFYVQIIRMCTTGRSKLSEMPKSRNKILASKRFQLPKPKVRTAQDTTKQATFQTDNDS